MDFRHGLYKCSSGFCGISSCGLAQFWLSDAESARITPQRSPGTFFRIKFKWTRNTIGLWRGTGCRFHVKNSHMNIAISYRPCGLIFIFANAEKSWNFGLKTSPCFTVCPALIDQRSNICPYNNPYPPSHHILTAMPFLRTDVSSDGARAGADSIKQPTSCSIGGDGRLRIPVVYLLTCHMESKWLERGRGSLYHPPPHGLP